MRAAVLAAHAGWAGPAERFPVIPDWEPPAADVGPAKSELDQIIAGAVPRVPRVPSGKRYRSHVSAAPETNPEAEAWATWVERAAIREYDGGMSRAEAETFAALELGPCPLHAD